MGYTESDRIATNKYRKKTGYAYQKNYNRENVRSASVGLPRDTYNAFKEKCAENGTPMNAVLKKRIERFIEESH